MKRIKISKKMKEIRSSTDYDLVKIVNDMKNYYNTNNFENKVLLRRLNELSVEKFYFDTLQGSLIGLVVSALLMDIGLLEGLSKILDAGFKNSMIAGMFAINIIIVILIIIAAIILGTINFFKYLQYKFIKSDVLNNYLDEVEEEIIRDILQKRIKT